MEEIREWLSQIICFLCLMKLLLHVIPDSGMKRYVRFFLRMLFLLVVLSPLGNTAQGERFLERMEQRSLMGLQQIYENGSERWKDQVLPVTGKN